MTDTLSDTAPDSEKYPNSEKGRGTDNVSGPATVLFILEELGLPYQSSFARLEDLLKEPFQETNPNVKLPGSISNSFCEAQI